MHPPLWAAIPLLLCELVITHGAPVALSALTTVFKNPEGPAQYCYEDAGPPWSDDEETFGDTPYYGGTAATPVPNGSTCVAPLSAACTSKGVKAAHLDGPIDCDDKGWFCRIVRQPGWVNPDFDDNNFAHCNSTDADERDNEGHCHGSDVDSTYGWWVRDHWFRGYAGTLHCCCDWSALKGLANRCDYRRFVNEDEAGECRDANEDHGLGYEDGCEKHKEINFVDPLYADDSKCWTVQSFADPTSVGEEEGEEEDSDDEDEEAQYFMGSGLKCKPRKLVKSKEECEDAIDWLELKLKKKLVTVENKKLAQGCLFKRHKKQKKRRLVFNTHEGGKGKRKWSPICRGKPPVGAKRVTKG